MTTAERTAPGYGRRALGNGAQPASASRTASRAWSSVVSNSGTVASEGLDEQVDLRAAEQDRLRAALGQCGHDLAEALARLVADDADAELLVDDAVDLGALAGLGHDHLEAVLVAHPPDVEVLLHRVGRGQQADALHPGGADGRGGGVGDMDERDVDRGLDRRRDLVHRVRAEHQQLGARVLEVLRFAREQRARRVPVAGALHRLHVREVDRPQQQVGGVQAAELVGARPR